MEKLPFTSWLNLQLFHFTWRTSHPINLLCQNIDVLAELETTITSELATAKTCISNCFLSSSSYVFGDLSSDQLSIFQAFFAILAHESFWRACRTQVSLTEGCHHLQASRPDKFGLTLTDDLMQVCFRHPFLVLS